MSWHDSYWLVLAGVLGPLATSLALNGVIRRWAARWGFVDQPGQRKDHETDTPLGGGIGILAAVVLPILAVLLFIWAVPPEKLPAILREHRAGLFSQTGKGMGILAGMLAIHVLGLVDDVRHLGPAVKLVVQFIVISAVVFFCDIRLLTVIGPALSVGVTIFWIVLITNAFNFLDNMDGLCAGVAAIAATILAWAALRSGQLFVPLMGLVMVGALLGFLAYNFSPASLFMGDAGSLPIGYTLAVLTVMTTYYNPETGTTPAGVFVPLVVLAVPLYDVVSVFYGRWRDGAPIFLGDHRHFSHRLVQRGMGPRTAVLTVYLATGATGLGAIFLPRADWPTAGVILAQCVCVVLMVALLEWRTGHEPKS